jgi:SecD/SecF fusion protein
MRNTPLWKPILILVVILGSFLLAYPPKEKLKLGLDLAGGTTLTYQVNVAADDPNAQGTVQQVIADYRDRVDPAGVRNLIWREQAGNRIEIQMAMASAESKERRRIFLEQRDKLLADNLSKHEIESALRVPAAERGAQLQRLSMGSSENQTRLSALAAAYDALQQAQTPYRALEEQMKQADAALAALPADAPAEQRTELTEHRTSILNDLVPATRAFAQSKTDYDKALTNALAINVAALDIERVLALPKDRTAAGKQAKPGKGESHRETAMAELLAKHPSRAEQIKAVAAAYESYEQLKGPLDDPNDLIELLKGSGVLEFRIAPSPALPDAAAYREQLRDKGPRAGANKSFRWLKVKEITSFAETAKDREALEKSPEAFFERMNLVGQRYAGDYYVLVANTPEQALTQASGAWRLTRAMPDHDSSGFPAVSFRLDTLGGQFMRQLTGKHVGEPMAIVLDDQLISAPRINEAIGDSGIITGGRGGFSPNELRYLVRTLGAGALEARVTGPISIQTTGPQLGEDNLDHGLEAAYLSIAIVGLFMIAYYMGWGIIAVGALVANVIIILGTMALIQATFTLPGIAGIVLTIGMAVDANVLIYERIREEIERKVDRKTAIRLGYEKAFATIVDANLTTLITCVVLYYTATADIKGFALVLGIGIVSTMFTAVFCTRVFVDIFMLRGQKRSEDHRPVWMLPCLSPTVRNILSPNIDWIGKRKMFYTFSLTLMTLSVIAVYSRGADLLDIEFRSGTQVSFALKDGQTMTLEQVRGRLDSAAQKLNQPLLRGNAASVVTQGVTQGTQANSFSVATLIEDSDLVSDAIRDAFSDVLDVQRPVSFRAVDAASLNEAPVFAVTDAQLGKNIGRPDVVRDAGEYLGGVAVVLEDLTPAVSEADLRQRVERMRLQPRYEKLNYRPFDVVGLDLAGGSEGQAGAAVYRSAVVLVRDDATNYADDISGFRDPSGLAATEWALVHDAMLRETSLDAVSSFSSQVSSTMQVQAAQAMVLSLLAVVAYIWLRFGSLRYGVAAIAALVHDVTIALGALAASHYIYDSPLGHALGLTDFKINLAIVAAVLTIVGYSLNDTIVVFDRIRENRGRLSVATAAIMNDSINQTISRTTLTSGTTMLAIIMLYLTGGDSVHGFAFSMMIGVFVGTYSSIAVAAPILLVGASSAASKQTKPGQSNAPAPAA